MDDVDRDKPTIPDGLPEWVQDTIRESKEWREMESGQEPEQAVSDSIEDDDLPF